MLTEGGMHTPFVVSWPGEIPGGQEYPHPVTALDVAATATAIANIETKPGDLDGVNLMPFLSGQNKAAPHDALMWRWVSQSAIREGNWKLLRGGDREYLFDLDADLEERHNLAAKHPEIANRLRKRLRDWAEELSPPGLAKDLPNGGAWGSYFDFYLDGKEPAPLREKIDPKTAANSARIPNVPWLLRSGRMRMTKDGLQITADNKSKRQTPFMARNSLNIEGPITAAITFRASEKGVIRFSWRTPTEKEFSAENRVQISVDASSDWQTIRTSLATTSKIVHVRVQVPAGETTIKTFELTPTKGKVVGLRK